MGRHISAGDITDAVDLRDFKSAKLWLDVAIGANGGTGCTAPSFALTQTDKASCVRDRLLRYFRLRPPHIGGIALQDAMNSPSWVQTLLT